MAWILDKARRLRNRLSDKPSGERALTLEDAQAQVLFHRRWSLFRYVHLLDLFEKIPRPRHVASIGCGQGWAELALAVAFPDVQFECFDLRINDRIRRAYPLPNLSFAEANLFELDDRYDLIFTIEVLEHIEDHQAAADHLVSLLSPGGHLFNLVPFAAPAEQENEALRQREWENHGHFRVGYNRDDLVALFPGQEVLECAGTYWRDHAEPLRYIMDAMPDETMVRCLPDLIRMGRFDLRDQQPASRGRAVGIKILTRKPQT